MFVYVVQQKSYGFWNFVGDCLMTIFTYGFWLIWVFVREMRKRSSMPGC
jgi:hypothetical protein